MGYEDYRAFWSALSETPWARVHLRYRVWLDDDGTLLSSLKLYRPEVRILGGEGRVAGLGAVFTPRSKRGRGHASALIRAVLEEARQRKDLAALLFSDVGTTFYHELGFRELPAEEAWGDLRRVDPGHPRGWRLRPMMAADLNDVMRSHDDSSRGRAVAILRDRDYWEYLVERSRQFFARLDGSGLSQRFQVAVRGDEFAGYLASVDSGDVWVVREVDAVGGEPESLQSIMRLGAIQARARGQRRCYAWLPRSVRDAMAEGSMRFRPRRKAIPMLQPLDDGPDLGAFDSPQAAFIPYLDQF